MQEVIESLESCVAHAKFVLSGMGQVGPDQYRQLFRQRRWDDSTWMSLADSELEIDDRHVAELAARLRPVVGRFVDSATGRIGYGLPLLLGGPQNDTYPTLLEFAKILIVGAVRIGAGRVAELLHRWTGGEPLRFRTNALLEGAHIDGPLHLHDGIGLVTLPKSPRELPAGLSFIQAMIPVARIQVTGSVMMSIDCIMSPALFLPGEGKAREMARRNGPMMLGARESAIEMVSNEIPNLSLEKFCESVSLACNSHVDWFLKWRELGDLGAFSDFPDGIGHKPKFRTGGTKISQADLEKAVELHRARHRDGNRARSVELAIRRWIRSKRPRADLSDKLIELRIALEALYEIGELTEKAFRVATYGAWHLGEDFAARRAIRDTLRKAYSDSSSAVHGGNPKHAAKDPGLVSSAQDLCRQGILKRLEETEVPTWGDLILGASDATEI